MYSTRTAIRACAPRRILLTGTLAIDHVGNYPGTFSELPRHGGINLSVQLDRIERRFGGCAMNIAYTLKLLGEDPVPFVFVGRDFDRDYARHLADAGIDMAGIQFMEAAYSSHAFIFTDRDQNQFTGFFSGPAVVGDLASRLRRILAERRFDYAIVAPDLPGNMVAAATVLTDAGIPFITDPGQNLTDFNAADALALVRLSRIVVVNEYEYATLKGLVGGVLDTLDLVVVTQGERGTRWRSATDGTGHEHAVSAAVVDPTGCGDAFRAGFLAARLRGADVRDAVRAGGVTSALVLEASGTQSHRCDDFNSRYRQAWRDLPSWLGTP